MFGIYTAVDIFCSHPKVEFIPDFMRNHAQYQKQVCPVKTVQKMTGYSRLDTCLSRVKPVNKQGFGFSRISKVYFNELIKKKKAEPQTYVNIAKMQHRKVLLSEISGINYDQHILGMNHCLQKRA